MKIGPAFPADLTAAGIPLDGILWTPDGIVTAPADVREAVDAVLAAHDPTKGDPSAVTVIVKIDLYQRMTDAEYAAMKAGVASQSERVQDVYRMADTFRSDSALWPLLKSMAIQLYGEQRAAELMTP